MEGLWSLNLIHLLDFYLAFTFLASTYRRIGQYQSIVKLVLSGPGRWPRLLKLLKKHRTIFLTWGTVAPALLALVLLTLQLLASRLLWPDAGRPPTGLTIAGAAEHWPSLAVILFLGLGMLGVDAYTLIVVGEIDRPLMEKYFDQAEYWLSSPAAHVVRIVTLGYINPRRQVSLEVQKALVDASSLLNTTLWWVNLQTGLRFFFGLSLWLTWAIGQA